MSDAVCAAKLAGGARNMPACLLCASSGCLVGWGGNTSLALQISAHIAFLKRILGSLSPSHQCTRYISADAGCRS